MIIAVDMGRKATKTKTNIIRLDFAKAFDKVPHSRLLHKLDFSGPDRQLDQIFPRGQARSQTEARKPGLQHHMPPPPDCVACEQQGLRPAAV